MKLPEADWQTRDGMGQLLRALGGETGKTRFVGGCVRDTLFGLPVSDVDLATRLPPDEVVERLRKARIKAVPTGIAHGTVTAVLRGHPVEVTTLRRDVSTDGRRATVAFTEDWQEDAARRDFTINAMSADPATRDLFDYFGGREDHAARRVRFIGDARTRIAEDHLRILRFFRFHARFGRDAPDPAGLDACAERANDLMALSRERIADELLKLLRLEDPEPTVRLMVERGILRPVLPEIDADGVSRLRALIDRERLADVPAEPLRRLAALLPPDPGLAASLSARLRLSNKATKRVVAAAERQPGDAADARALAYRIGPDEAVDRLLLGEEPAEEMARKAQALAGWSRPHFPLTGGDLIAMGLQPGPVVARTYQAIEREWVRRGFDPAGLDALARAHVDQALRDSQ